MVFAKLGGVLSEAWHEYWVNFVSIDFDQVYHTLLVSYCALSLTYAHFLIDLEALETVVVNFTSNSVLYIGLIEHRENMYGKKLRDVSQVVSHFDVGEVLKSVAFNGT